MDGEDHAFVAQQCDGPPGGRPGDAGFLDDVVVAAIRRTPPRSRPRLARVLKSQHPGGHLK